MVIGSLRYGKISSDSNDLANENGIDTPEEINENKGITKFQKRNSIHFSWSN